MTAEQLADRRRQIAAAPDLQRLLAHARERAAPLLERMPVVPSVKALLSVDGGACPRDGTALRFDPWSPAEHRCPACGETFRGERHDRSWAKYQHLWLAERAAHLAALQALDGNAAAGARAREILAVYAQRYWSYPNRDNVLGPSRLFFSTYLESIWILNYLAAAMLLRESGALDESARAGVSRVADEAATMIGEYDERFSNRQTWNNAALTAIAVWFEDEDLGRTAIEGPTGLIAHLRGFRRDGLWYEGENYHLFALRGFLTGAGWARRAGVDVGADPELAARVRTALLGPVLSALPDLTFPARKDARFGVSLAQPMHVELWEVGRAWLEAGSEKVGTAELDSWLAALYRAPQPKAEQFESYLHDAPGGGTPTPVSRSTLSWWALLEMAPQLPQDSAPWRPESVLLPSQGLAVLRAADRYASLECGDTGGGHGHPDRLNALLHAAGVYWLPDFGTGSYVSRDLFWYRSTLAHNAPRLDGTSQPLRDATCAAFDTQDDWGWARAVWGDVTRTLVAGPRYLLDVVDLAGSEDHLLELPWHLGGAGDVTTPGTWEDGTLDEEFVGQVRRFVPTRPGPIVIEHAADGARLTLHLVFDGELLRAAGPGRPGGGSATREPFYVVRTRGRNLRLVTVLEPWREAPLVRAVRATGDVIDVDTTAGGERHRDHGRAWEIEAGGRATQLAGARAPEEPFVPIIELDRPLPARGTAMRIDAPPVLDGELDGFDTNEPLSLDVEDQYRRSEEGYHPEDIAAVAYVNWDDAALYLAVEVAKPELCLRPAAAPPLRFDNEPDDIHSDGLQVYISTEEEPGGAAGGCTAFLVVPEEGGRLRVRTVSDATGDPASVRGAWRRTDAGYRVTLALAWPEGLLRHAGAQLRFDLLVNEMVSGRERRAGQLAWSGGNGWVWLWGDRQARDRLGILELVG